MQILIVGTGKLANTILLSNLALPDCQIVEWNSFNQNEFNDRAIVVHAGSGRQLDECLEFCRRTNSVFIELSTGLPTEVMSPEFTLIICPNTSILLLKTLNMLKQFGKYFSGEKVSIVESHQESKKSAPGTAYNFAEFLSYPVEEIKSVRDTEVQRGELGIPDEFLAKHAYHRITIGEEHEQITIETKVLGHDSYATGVQKIISAALQHTLEKRRYSVLDLIDLKIL